MQVSPFPSVASNVAVPLVTWGQDGPEPIDPVDAIIVELRDPERDQDRDGELLTEGLEILRRRSA